MNQRHSQSFFARRWRGEVPMHTVLWRDMFVVGTAVNVLTTFVALMAASQGAPSWAAVVIHFTPLPYSIFLFAAVGRASPRSRLATGLSMAWLAIMTIV